MAVMPSSFSLPRLIVTAFANQVVVADDHLGVAAAVADVLRLAAKHDARIDVIVAADRNPAHDRDVIFQPRAVADADVGTDHREGADFDFRIDFSTGMDRDVFGDETSHTVAPTGPSARHASGYTRPPPGPPWRYFLRSISPQADQRDTVPFDSPTDAERSRVVLLMRTHSSHGWEKTSDCLRDRALHQSAARDQ